MGTTNRSIQPPPGGESGEAARVGRERRERLRWPELAFGLAGVAVGVGIVLAVPDLRHALSLALHGDLSGLRREFRSLGTSGAALLVGLMLAHALIYYPTELVTATAGVAYGFLPGLALVTGGWLLSGLLSYGVGVVVGEPLLSLIFGRRRFAALERAVERGGASLLLAVRLVPVFPFSLVGYVAGAVRAPLWRFAWTTVVGYLPLTAIITYLGSQSNSLSVTDPRLWGAMAVILALLLAARRVRLSPPPPPGGEDGDQRVPMRSGGQ